MYRMFMLENIVALHCMLFSSSFMILIESVVHCYSKIADLRNHECHGNKNE